MIVDQPGAAEFGRDEQAHRAAGDRVDRLQGLGVAGFQIIDDKASAFDRILALGKDRAGRAAVLQPGCTGFEHTVQRGRRGALLVRQVGVARGHRESVLFSHGRHRENFGRNVEIARHGRDHLELLVVLLAKGCEVRLHLEQELGHHGADAAEEMRTELVLEAYEGRAARGDPGFKALRIHCGDTGCPNRIHLEFRQRSKIGIPGSRIAAKILVRTELGRD